jgi:hypothetical protein
MSEEKRTEKQQELLSIFNKTTDFSNLWDKAQAIQNRCKDYTITDPSRWATYSPNLTFNYIPEGAVAKYQTMSDHAFSQLCAKLGVPVRYMRKCLDDGEVQLVSDNINTWLEKFKKSMFIRTYENRVRGVLSDKFSVLDTPDILDVVSDTVQRDYGVKGLFMNEERFHARLIQKEMLNIPGEDLFAGLQIDSSDVGRSILIVKFMIYKQVCTNGLTISKGGGILFEQKHIGISSDEFRKGLKENLNKVPELVSSVIDAIKESKSGKFTSDMAFNSIAHMREQLSMTEEVGNKVIDLMNDKYGRSRWGMINGITELAQQYTLERRIQLENYAGNLLNVA